MFKGTPGPWEISFENGRYVIQHDAAIGKAAIAITGGAYPDSLENARLIALAPTLLEAAIMQDEAELARSDCDECGGEDDWSHCSLCSVLFGDAIDARRAAIALATGETE